eukprot:6491413-Amphidinium_carterae.2
MGVRALQLHLCPAVSHPMGVRVHELHRQRPPLPSNGCACARPAAPPCVSQPMGVRVHELHHKQPPSNGLEWPWTNQLLPSGVYLFVTFAIGCKMLCKSAKR